ncbi:MAG TPA: acyl carrier protein [Nitrospirae bacterium]|nr:acyl carrier protein [Nitrospirota bacterium]
MEQKENTRDKIYNFIIENYLFGDTDTELKDDESLLAKGIVDSTGILELVLYVEKTFNIKVKDEDMIPDNLDSINQIVRYINDSPHR